MQSQQINDIHNNSDYLFKNNQPKLITLINKCINFDELIPQKFKNNYYKSIGHPRYFTLSSMICLLTIQKILSISETSTFLNILNLSSELRDLCGLKRIPHASQITRFKINFHEDLLSFFNSLVSITEPICRQIDSKLSKIIISDTTGIKAYVKENNPKYFDSLLRYNKRIEKRMKDFNPDSYTKSKMPKESYANKDIKLAYMNGHFCYSLKCSLLTNGLGVIRHIEFPSSTPLPKDILDDVSKKDEYDSKTLIPSLNNFFANHPTFTYKYFLGDAGFDSIDNYKFLYNEKSIIPIIPINPRATKDLPQPNFTEDGIPTCPKNSKLLMKYDGISKEKGRATRIKWLCPKSKRVRKNKKTYYELSCKTPCSKSKCGRVIQTPIGNNPRLISPIPRNTQKWESLYKIRTIIERTIAMLKCSMGIKNIQTRETSTIKSEVLLGAITQQIVVLLASKLNSTKTHLAFKYLIA